MDRIQIINNLLNDLRDFLEYCQALPVNCTIKNEVKNIELDTKNILECIKQGRYKIAKTYIETLWVNYKFGDNPTD